MNHRVEYEYKGNKYTVKELEKLTHHDSRYIYKYLDLCKSQKDFEEKLDKHSNCYEYKGEKYTRAEIRKMAGINETTLAMRLFHGWSIEKIVETPHKGETL